MTSEPDTIGSSGLASLGSLLHRLNPFTHEKKPEDPTIEPDAYDELRMAISKTFVLEKSHQSKKEAEQLKTRITKLKSQPRDTTFPEQLTANL